MLCYQHGLADVNQIRNETDYGKNQNRRDGDRVDVDQATGVPERQDLTLGYLRIKWSF